MTEHPPLLSALALLRGYGGPPVLRGVDLEIRPGEGLALIGPNGAGKSTLLRVLAGLHKLGGGRIELQGRPFRPHDPEQRRWIGFVSHESLLYDGLTARENLRFAADLFGLDRPRDRCEQALTEVGLEWVGERPVHSYSRGMRQRLTLARALLHAPVLLLLDEPMTGLDPEGRRSLEERLIGFRESGAGIVLATHELQHVAPVATRVAFLKGGRIQEGGPIAAFPGTALEARYRELFSSQSSARGGSTRL